jgi:hypothetical protein
MSKMSNLRKTRGEKRGEESRRLEKMKRCGDVATGWGATLPSPKIPQSL